MRTLALTGFLVGALLIGCSTLPPAKRVQDLHHVIGRWKGPAKTITGERFLLTFIIHEDGTYDAFGDARQWPGKLTISNDGTILFTPNPPETPKRSGTLILYEGEGKRVLRGWTKDGLDFELKPAEL